MRRIYLEYLAGLTTIFLVSIYSYGFIVYELSTDYEYILRDHEAEAYQKLVNTISKANGIDMAETALFDYAAQTRQKLREHTD